MVQPLPQRLHAELPIIAQRVTPASISYRANVNREKSKLWPQDRSYRGHYWSPRDVDSEDYLPEPLINPNLPQQVSQPNQLPKNPTLLSKALNKQKYRDLPALPGVYDYQSRANSFDYNDDLSYFSSNVIQNQCPPPPPPPLKTSAPPTSFSQILGNQFDHGSNEHSNISSSESPLPDSLVPGRINTNDFTEKKGQFKRPTVPFSFSSRTSPRRKSLVQRASNVSKSLTHPRTPRDRSFPNVIIESQIISTSKPGDPIINSILDKPLPYIPPTELYKLFQDERKDRKKLHSTVQPQKLDLIDSEELSKTTVDQNNPTMEQNNKHLSSESKSEIDFFAQTKESVAKDNSRYLYSPKLPDLTRISVLSADIFSKINAQDKPNTLVIPVVGTASPDFKLESVTESEDRPKKDNPTGIDTAANHTLAEPTGLDSLSENKIQAEKEDITALSDICPIKDRSPSAINERLKKNYSDVYSKVMPKSTLSYGSVQDDQLKFYLQESPKPLSVINSKNTDQTNTLNSENHTTLSSELVNSSAIILYEETKVSTTSARNSLPKSKYASSYCLNYTYKSHQAIIRDNSSIESKEFENPSKEFPRHLNVPSKQSLGNFLQSPPKVTLSSSSSLQDYIESKVSKNALVSRDHPNSETSTLTRNHHDKALENFPLEAKSMHCETSFSVLATTNSNSSTNSATETSTVDISEIVNLKLLNRTTKTEGIKNSTIKYQPISDAVELEASDNNMEKVQNNLTRNQDDGLTREIIYEKEILGSSKNFHDLENSYLPAKHDNYWGSIFDRQLSISGPTIPPENYTIVNSNEDTFERSELDTIFVDPLSMRQKKNFGLGLFHPSYQTQISQQLDDLHSCINGLIPSSSVHGHGIPIHTDDALPSAQISSVIENQAKSEFIMDNISAENPNLEEIVPTGHPLKQYIPEKLDSSDKINSERDTQAKSTASPKKNIRRPSSLLSQRGSLSTISSPISSTGIQASSSQQPFRTQIESKSPSLTSPSAPTMAPTFYPKNLEQLPSFKEILDLKTPQERIRAFDDTREKCAAIDMGLGDWIREMKKSLQYESVTANFDVSDARVTSTLGFPTEKNGRNSISPSLVLMTHIEQSQDMSASTTSPKTRFSVGPNVSSFHHLPPSTVNKLTTQQVQAKGKELFHTAGVLGGKAGKAGKGLLVKGKNKLRPTGGGDRVD